MKNGKYILIVAPDWYKGKLYRGRYCYEHHAVWEKTNGKPVPDGFVVHHKDGNRFNNSVDNLELLERVSHNRLHGLQEKRKVAILRCPCCHKIFERDARILPFRNLVFCSRRCVGLYGFGSVSDKKKEQDKARNLIEIIKK